MDVYLCEHGSDCKTACKTEYIANSVVRLIELVNIQLHV